MGGNRSDEMKPDSKSKKERKKGERNNRERKVEEGIGGIPGRCRRWSG